MKRLTTIESVIEELDDAGLCIDSEKQFGEYRATVRDSGAYFTLEYTDEQEGCIIDSVITVSGDCVRVARSGGIESIFNFREGVRESSLYKSAGYPFDAEIFTRKIRNNLTQGEGSLTIFYDMTVGGAKRRVKMKINIGEVCEE